MRALKSFKEFIKIGIMRRRTPDFLRADSLLDEAEKRKKFIDEMSSKIGLNDENANYFIENSYDTLIELIRAKLFIDGFRASGEGAHEAEVSYMKDLGFSNKDIRFMNDLRYYRNGILYYGENFDSEYATKVLLFLKGIYPEIVKLLEKR